MIEQGTPEWFAERLGKATASRIADIIARTKSGYSTSRANYAAQLIAERLTGHAQESYTNAAMQWGTETEPHARAAYEFHSDQTVELCGFIAHPKIAMSGASPDGLVGTAGLLEIKCPNTATHIDTLLGGKTPEKYITQMQWQMACTGRAWCDFVSFDPRMPEEMRFFTARIERDGKRIAELETEVSAFLTDIDRTVTDLLKRFGRKEAA